MQKLSNFLNNYLKPFLKTRNRKGILSVFNECYAAYRSYGTFPEQYFKLGLYMREMEGDVRDYMPKALIHDLQAALNGKRFPPEITDKVAFGRIMQKHGVPCVGELFTIEADGRMVDPEGHALDRAEAEARIRSMGGRAFLKAVKGMGGEGAEILDIDRVDLSEPRFRGVRWLVQPVIAQHPVLAAIYPDAVNTVRIDTLLTDDGCLSNAAVLRVGSGGSVVDNAVQGGLAVPIDLESGALGRVGRRKPSQDIRFHSRHPDTQVRFEGIELPFWPELLAAVRAGAEALRPLRSLGWDVAITPSGPVIIEANGFWGCEVFQLSRGLRPTVVGDMACRLRGLPEDRGPSGDLASGARKLEGKP